MKCSLCRKEIENYSREFNHLEIDELNSVEICQECIDKFIKWQGKIFAKLFPTRTLKKKSWKED